MPTVRSLSSSISWSVLPLLALAGATDALMILHSKELLAVYMTGNSTKFAEFLLSGVWSKVGQLAAVLAAFIVFTTLAAWIGDRAGYLRSGLLLLIVGALLVAAAPLAVLVDQAYPLVAVMTIAAAMGTLNQVRADEPGVTFVTGTLVKLGRSLAAGKLPGALDCLARWFGFLLGALLGAFADVRLSAYTLSLLGVLAILGGIVVALAASRAHTVNA